MHCWSAAFAARSSSTFGETNEEFGSPEHGRSRASTRICSFWAGREPRYDEVWGFGNVMPSSALRSENLGKGFSVTPG
jgi:hypothetical protein